MSYSGTCIRWHVRVWRLKRPLDSLSIVYLRRRSLKLWDYMASCSSSGLYSRIQCLQRRERQQAKTEVVLWQHLDKASSSESFSLCMQMVLNSHHAADIVFASVFGLWKSDFWVIYHLVVFRNLQPSDTFWCLGSKSCIWTTEIMPSTQKGRRISKGKHVSTDHITQFKW